MRIIVVTMLLLSSKLTEAAGVSFADATGVAGLESAKSLCIVVVNAFMSLQLLNAVRILANPNGQSKLNVLVYKVFVPMVVIVALTSIF